MEAAALPPLPAAVSDALSARSITLTTKCESTARTIATIGSGGLLSYAEVAALAGNPGAALATSSHRHKLYEEALDFVLPLHRVMSTKDHFARVDGAVGLGAVGRVFKCAIRELEGGYASLKKVPSINGLPLQTCPPYKDLVLLGLADPSLAGAATTSQKLMAVVKRLFPALDFKKKLYAAALAKAVENGALKKTNDGPK
eukprot:COSAG04_NODE_2852_length_3486_cov_1.350162_5_plen_199_part_01